MPVERLPLPGNDHILRHIQLSEQYPHDFSRYPLTIPAIANMGLIQFASGVTKGAPSSSSRRTRRF